MPTAKDGLKDRLTRYRQIRLSVIGRKSGKTISPASVFHFTHNRQLTHRPVPDG